jgi:hypothetical protein
MSLARPTFPRDNSLKTNLIHCSYHKCLTKYFKKVMSRLYNSGLPMGPGYRHFRSNEDRFYSSCADYRVASINNRILDFSRLGDFRISRFIRDPRDLVVSGYFYHHRGAEKWCNVVSPDGRNWKVVNGNIPTTMKQDQSFSNYLHGLNQEDGLIAEIDFRKNHFESMAKWPVDDSRIKTIRYEDLLGHEGKVFDEIMSFYGVSWPERKLGAYLAQKYAASNSRDQPRHIRDPNPKQWEVYFTPRVAEYFNQRYGDLLEQLGYG